MENHHFLWENPLKIAIFNSDILAIFKNVGICSIHSSDLEKSLLATARKPVFRARKKRGQAFADV